MLEEALCFDIKQFQNNIKNHEIIYLVRQYTILEI